MKKFTIIIVIMGVCTASFMACKGNATPEKEQTDSIQVQQEKSAPLVQPNKPLEEDCFSVIVPDGWKGNIENHSIEVKKPRPDNTSRYSIFTETLVFEKSLEDYLKQSDVSEENKLGEYTIGKNKWVAYDKSERGYPVIYLTEYPSRNRVLCVRTSGIDVQGVGNPDVEMFLQGITLK